MTKIKVLEIIGDSTLAGAPRHFLALLKNLDLQKFELLAISPSGPLAGEIRNLRREIRLETIPMRSRFDTHAIKKIRAHIKRAKPDLIHIHGTRAGSLGRLAAIGLKIPVIYTEHLWTKNYRLSFLNHGLQLSALWFLDMFTDLNIAVSQAVKDFMVESQISRPEKIEVIYNGIEMPTKKARIFEENKITLGTVGTLNYHKGIQYLISAMPEVVKEFPEARLEIIGEGIYKSKLQALARKMRLAKLVNFTGFVKDIEKEMLDFDVYIQPSISESFGLAIVQAMSLGIPIVATSTGGIPEVVTAGKSGILVPAGKPRALAEAILGLLRDHKKAKSMGRLAAEEAKIKFTLEDMVKATEGIYAKVAKTGA